MTVLFFAIVLAWLLVLTVAFLGVTRHLGSMQAGGAGLQAPNGGAMFDADGPWIPSLLPERAATALGARGIQTDDLVATFFSSSCGSCLERAEQIAGAITDASRNVFLVAGWDPDRVGDITRVLAPTQAPIITDPDAQNVVKSLDIRSSPFTFRVIGGQVIAKAFVRSVGDYTRMTAPDLAVIPTAANADDAVVLPPMADRLSGEVLDGSR